MQRYGPTTYGDHISSIYDVLYPPGPDADDAVEVLAGLAGTGKELELGIDTGRVAVPLAARGVTIQGIDVSEAMVAEMRAKPGGDAIPVTLADFTHVPVEGPFRL